MRAAGGAASLDPGKVHPDAEAPALKAVTEGQPGMVQFRNAPHDGQAQANTLHRPGAEAMKALADPVPLLHRHAGAIVLHRQRHLPLLDGQAHPHLAPRLPVA